MPPHHPAPEAGPGAEAPPAPASGEPLLVVGAGAVGLFLSLCLARRGLPVTLLEKRRERSPSSRAIGVSSPSLELLAREGLAEAFLAEGVPVREALVSDGKRELGRLDFGRVGGPFPFVLSLPQARTEALLEGAVRAEPLIDYRPGCEVLGLRERPEGGLELSARDEKGRELRLGAPLLLAAEGKRGILGEAKGLVPRSRSYRDHFLMGDFPDETGWAPTARLFFTERGSVESFPLPGGLRRWVLSCEPGRAEDGGAWLAAEVRARTGRALDPASIRFESSFRPERRLARRWASGPLFLLGDAAHLMSPIVGQNMNTGFADAAWLAEALAARLGPAGSGPASSPRRLSPAELADLGRAYARARTRPTRAAANRAWAMMRLGTARGRALTALRSPLVAAALAGPTAGLLAGIFTMKSIPEARA